MTMLRNFIKFLGRPATIIHVIKYGFIRKSVIIVGFLMSRNDRNVICMKYMEKVKGYLCECQLQFAEFCCELNTAHIWQQQRLYWSQTCHHQLVNISKYTDGKVHMIIHVSYAPLCWEAVVEMSTKGIHVQTNYALVACRVGIIHVNTWPRFHINTVFPAILIPSVKTSDLKTPYLHDWILKL